MGLLRAAQMSIGMSLVTRKVNSTFGQLSDDVASTWNDLTSSSNKGKKEEKPKPKKGQSSEPAADSSTSSGYLSWLSSPFASSSSTTATDAAPVEPPKPTLHAGIVVIHVERIEHVSIAKNEKRFISLRFGRTATFQTATEKIDAEGCAKFKSKRFSIDINEQTVNNTLLVQVTDKSGVVSHTAHVSIEQLTGGLNQQYYVLRDALDNSTAGQILLRHIFIAAELKQQLVIDKR